MVTRDEIKKIRDEFLAAQDDTVKEEWYCTDRGLAEHVLQRLWEFTFGEEDAKEARRKQWEELNKEFGS